MPEMDDFFLPPDEMGALEFEIEEADVRSSEVRDEVAQPGDLAHTSDVIWEEEDWDSEPVPENFSFDDQQPAWARRPKDSNPTNYGKSSEVPEWLRDVFEDDDE
jgi:hypothetical protein